MDSRYVAGYFDGEGYIGLYWNKGCADDRYRSGFRTGSWIRAVGINNTYLPVIKSLYTTFGGSLRTLREAEGICKKQYAWTLGAGKEIKHFLDFLFPHLVEKKPQASVMLAVLAGKCPPEEAEIRLKELKHGK